MGSEVLDTGNHGLKVADSVPLSIGFAVNIRLYYQVGKGQRTTGQNPALASLAVQQSELGCIANIHLTLYHHNFAG